MQLSDGLVGLSYGKNSIVNNIDYFSELPMCLMYPNIPVQQFTDNNIQNLAYKTIRYKYVLDEVIIEPEPEPEYTLYAKNISFLVNYDGTIQSDKLINLGLNGLYLINVQTSYDDIINTKVGQIGLGAKLATLTANEATLLFRDYNFNYYYGDDYVYRLDKQPNTVDDLQFSSASDQISITSTSDLIVTDVVSINLWVKITTSNTDWVRLVGKGSADYNSSEDSHRNYGVWLQAVNYGKHRVLFQLTYGSNNYFNLYSDTSDSLDTGNWHNITCTYKKNGNANIYINGKKSFSNSIGNITLNTSTNPLTIGYGFAKDNHTWLQGEMKGISIYKKELEKEQIENQYNFTNSYLITGDIFNNLSSSDSARKTLWVNNSGNPSSSNNPFGTNNSNLWKPNEPSDFGEQYVEIFRDVTERWSNIGINWWSNDVGKYHGGNSNNPKLFPYIIRYPKSW